MEWEDVPQENRFVDPTESQPNNLCGQFSDHWAAGCLSKGQTTVEFGMGSKVCLVGKGKTCPPGKYEGSLTARFRYAGRLLSLPPKARRILRHIDAATPEIRL